jgi:ketosteroid isomerase-like protein
MPEMVSILTTSLFAAAFAWSAHGQNSETIPAGIENLHENDITATIARDADALTALLVDDAVLLQPGTPPIVGKAAFHDFMKQALTRPPSKELNMCLTSATSKFRTPDLAAVICAGE